MIRLISAKIMIFCFSCILASAQSDGKFSVAELKQDIIYLKNTMEVSNYNFYALSSEARMDNVFSNIISCIDDSISSLEAYRLFQPYVALAGMSHCYIEHPWKEYSAEAIQKGGKLFPLRLYFENGKVLIRANFTQNTLIEKGDEILSVNGEPVNHLLNRMHNYISGPTKYFKNSQIEQREFTRFYWFFFGDKPSFTLQIRKKSGEQQDLTIKAISGREFEEQMRTQASMLRLKREFYVEDKLAYLKPGHFLNDIPFDPENPALFDNTEFCHFIDSAFSHFNNMKATSLIIDLRYNPGGDNSFSDYMISYFADRAFCFNSKFTIKTSQVTKDAWKEIDAPEHQELKKKIMSLESGTYFEAPLLEVSPLPDSLRFKGRVYVLINRYSYSNTASVAATIQDYDFGSIVGEETAEIVSSYGAVHNFRLPNTGLNVIFPKALGVRPNGDASQRGVIPDYPVDENILTDKDEVLEFTLEMINKVN